MLPFVEKGLKTSQKVDNAKASILVIPQHIENRRTGINTDGQDKSYSEHTVPTSRPSHEDTDTSDQDGTTSQHTVQTSRLVMRIQMHQVHQVTLLKPIIINLTSKTIVKKIKAHPNHLNLKNHHQHKLDII